MPSKPELMSPAGYWPQLQTAIECGADAVYFGLNHFSARAKVGFSLAELPEVMETLHGRGVKGFVTFNTLVFDHELELAESAIIEMANAGVDAVIVQDIGIAKLIHQIAPDLHIHGSTQMSITSAEGAELAKSFGCSRVVLGRELSLTDIRKIRESTDVELEVFVHGALCVSYSGQCFSSEAWGGRSANRGKCAQACRLSYDLIVDGEQRDLGEYRYLLSPGDLYALEQIPELVEIGVHCLKIEGRYKDADYVAVTTRAYREAIDLACDGIPNEISLEEKLELEQIYSRGLGSHFISGVNHQTVVEGRAPRHRGVLVAEVLFVGKNSVGVKLKHEIKRGDGVVFDAANWRSPDEPEEGGNVYEVKFAAASANVAAASGSKAKSPTSAPSSTSPRNDPSLKNATLSEKAGDKKRVGNIATLEFGHGEIDFERIRVGDLIWRTRDPQLNKRLKTITQTAVPLATQPVEFDVTAAIGKPLEIVARIVMSSDFSEIGTRTAQVGSVDITKDGEMNGDSALLPEASATMQASYCGEQPLSAADKRPLDLETLTDKLGRLGGTPYHLSEIRLLTKDAVFVRTSELNEARRQLVDQLFDTASTVHPIPAKPALQQAIAGLRPSISPSPNLPIPRSHHLPISIHLLVRTPEQLDGAIDAASTQPDAIASITLDYLELYGLRPSVEKIRAAGIRPRVASPRILKPSEQNVIRFLESLECDILIRSGGLLGDFREVKAPAETSDHREVEAPERKNTSPENDIQRIGDFSLNAANALTCRAYLDMGLTRITPTYDLNAEQITDLTKMIPADQLEVIAYSHLPVFHTEHCVFCRFLSDGTDHTNCGHPCEKHRIAVRDHAGRAHPVMADVGCRNTVFGAEAQTDSAATKQWRAAGIANFRLEFVHQTPAQVTAIASAFVGYLNDTLPRNEFDALLKSQSPQKTTTGSLFVPADFKQLVSLN